MHSSPALHFIYGTPLGAQSGGPPEIRMITTPDRLAGPRRGLLEEISSTGFHSLTHVSIRSDTKDALQPLSTAIPLSKHEGAHLTDTTQIPGLLDLIVKEAECMRHVLNPNEVPRLQLLVLRYGVTLAALRKCNCL